MEETHFDKEFFTLQKIDNKYFIKTESVEDILSEFIDNYSDSIEPDTTELQSFYNKIKKLLLQYGNKNYYFSPNLSDSFVNKEIALNDYLTTIRNFINNSVSKDSNIPFKDIKIKVFNYLQNKKKEINYFLTFEKLKSSAHILVLSNRIGGWSNPKFQISEDFSAEIKSNFGYGRASYFFLSIYYKNINISKFSDWIYYRFAKFYEISRYTKKYHYVGESKKKIIYYESWSEIIKFCYDSINLIETDLDNFINIYILKECESLVDGLHYIIQNDTFDFLDIYSEENLNKLPDFKRVNLKGEELIEFRTEKIIGALDFITEINILSELTDMTKFILKIEELNIKFFPIAANEFKNIAPIYISKKNEYETYAIQYNKYIADSYELIDSLKTSIKNSNDELEIKNLNNKIDKLKSEMGEECKQSIKFHNSVNHLRIVYEHFENYIEKYNNYFNKK